jgi:hypothetical protein
VRNLVVIIYVKESHVKILQPIFILQILYAFANATKYQQLELTSLSPAIVEELKPEPVAFFYKVQVFYVEVTGSIFISWAPVPNLNYSYIVCVILTGMFILVILGI